MWTTKLCTNAFFLHFWIVSGSLVNTCVCLKQNTLASNKTTDFRFLGESPSGWLQEPCEALIRVIRMNPSNGLSISENPLNQLNPWLKNSVNIRSIRPIVPQELVYIKTYPFGMIKLIQQIYRIYSNPHTELCK